jgi:hypothetical protein
LAQGYLPGILSTFIELPGDVDQAAARAPFQMIRERSSLLARSRHLPPKFCKPYQGVAGSAAVRKPTYDKALVEAHLCGREAQLLGEVQFDAFIHDKSFWCCASARRFSGALSISLNQASRVIFRIASGLKWSPKTTARLD